MNTAKTAEKRWTRWSTDIRGYRDNSLRFRKLLNLKIVSIQGRRNPTPVSSLTLMRIRLFILIRIRIRFLIFCGSRPGTLPETIYAKCSPWKTWWWRGWWPGPWRWIRTPRRGAAGRWVHLNLRHPSSRPVSSLCENEASPQCRLWILFTKLISACFSKGLQGKNRKSITGFFVYTEGSDDGMPWNKAKVSRPKKDPEVICHRVCVSCWNWLGGECYGGSQPCINHKWECTGTHNCYFWTFCGFFAIIQFRRFLHIVSKIFWFFLLKKKSITYVPAGLKLANCGRNSKSTLISHLLK